MTLNELIKNLNELQKTYHKDKINVTINGNPIFRMYFNNNTELLNFEEGSDM